MKLILITALLSFSVHAQEGKIVERPQASQAPGSKYVFVKSKPAPKRQTDYGMTKAQVLVSTWSVPKRRVREGGYEWWDYGCNNWLLFYGGELVEFYTAEDFE